MRQAGETDTRALVSFANLDKAAFDRYAPELFRILESNMSIIAPTGNTWEDDYAVWYRSLGSRLQEKSWQIVLIFEASTENLIGYFQYSLSEEVFMMEEAQIVLPYQGKYGLFRNLFAFVLPQIGPNIAYVEAYANKRNAKSMAILERMGLQKIGCNKNGNSFHYRGSFSDLLCWFSGR